MSAQMDDIVDAYSAVDWGSPEEDALRAARGDDYVRIYNDNDNSSPSEVHGMKLIAGVFFAVVVFAFFMVALIMYLSKKQEQGKRDRRQAKKDDEITKLQTKLECKPWHNGCDSATANTANATERTISLRVDSNSFDDLSSCSSDPQDTASMEPSSFAAVSGVPEPPKDPPELSAFGKEGSVCALCSEPFQVGQPVVESNNPTCKHCHHKVCIDKWLRIQNTCPVCNQAYVLQTV